MAVPRGGLPSNLRANTFVSNALDNLGLTSTSYTPGEYHSLIVIVSTCERHHFRTTGLRLHGSVSL